MNANGGGWFESARRVDLWRWFVALWVRVRVNSPCCGLSPPDCSSSSTYPCEVADFVARVACGIECRTLPTATLMWANTASLSCLAHLVVGGVLLSVCRGLVPPDGLDRCSFCSCHLCSLSLRRFLSSALCDRLFQSQVFLCKYVFHCVTFDVAIDYLISYVLLSASVVAEVAGLYELS